ncbi:MAG: ATP-binding protein [Acidimicrobiales bacterium]|jgi:signal transduction histidine kinase|nr:ATP-binding protein [Acidimicrobiales bacterium]MDP6298550.1 ATP-binding protein [Acidimicrobiales bacterium]HJM29141.1 ATP-binding protein [Acidimicrobiales bacterium]HJM97051.1 ATP-binding protein [Acidimicrobiales bacterium]
MTDDNLHFVQEIHDNVLQDLHVLTLNLSTGTDPSRDKQELLADMWNLQIALQKVQTDLRALIEQEQQRNAPLSVRLNGLMEFFSSDTHTVSHTLIDGIDKLDEPIQHEIFYIIKEAFANAIKHSEGDSFTLTVNANNDQLQFEVTDNGIGLPDQFERSSGTQNMRSRIDRIGGTLTIENIPAGGVRIIASIPN